MTQEQDLATIARSIVNAGSWPSVPPMRAGRRGCRRSRTRRSRNLAARPQVAIAIYDSHRAGGWSALYVAAVAEQFEDVDVALEVFNRRSEAQGLRAWSRAEVVPQSEFRLYCATAGEQFVLDDHDGRLPVHLH